MSNTDDLHGVRRVPAQERSRRRVEAILDAAAASVLEVGVAETTTRTIAEGAKVPPASVYKYYADKESVLLDMVARDMAAMLEEVLVDLAGVEDFTLDALIDVAVRGTVRAYERRPALVEVWLRGRVNPTLHAAGRERNHEVVDALLEMAVSQGLCRPDLPRAVPLMAVETGDRVLQLAFQDSYTAEQDLLEEYVAMMRAYLAPWVIEASDRAR